MRRAWVCLILIACGGRGTDPAMPYAPPAYDSGRPPVSQVTSPPVAAPPPEDPYLWLEDVDGEKSMTWVKAQNATAEAELATPALSDREKTVRTILESDDRIPDVEVMAGKLYNLWRDAKHPRGLWRRTTLAEYGKAAPAWETILDIDELNAKEHESWVWKRVACLPPKYEKCLVSLSRGGADAVVVRELDIPTKSFVAGGFALPEAKSRVAWRDENAIYVGTDFGEGSMTASGFPRIAKLWTRGTPLDTATTVYEGKDTDVSVGAYRTWTLGKTYDVVYDTPSAFTTVQWLAGADGKLAKIDKPDDAEVSFWGDQILVTLRTAWDKWPAGALLVESAADFAAGQRAFTMLYTPTAKTSLAGVAMGKTTLYVTELDDVHDVLYAWKRTGKTWKRTAVKVPPLVTFEVEAYDSDVSDDYWMHEEGFLQPPALSLVAGGKKKPMKHAPAFFDTKGLEVTQHFVTSADGTRVPYFLVAKQGLVLDGSTPTVIEGYGGFEVSEMPFYSGSIGALWLAHGGAYVVPNLRGGGEYGPTWHEQAILHHRQRAYDDFAAVAADLIARKVTSPAKLGIKGGSNGGLLVGVMMTEHPELFGAVVCQAPLLDMKRYHKLLAGASWMGEYGDPDTAEDWAAIKLYSPYQNVKEGVTYPRVLFTTSTRDDRVHPGHARKMAARMLAQHHDVLFWENTEGGHAGAADAPQRAHVTALTYTFLANQLKL